MRSIDSRQYTTNNIDPSPEPWTTTDRYNVWVSSFRDESLRSTCEEIHDPLYYQLRYGEHAKFGK